MSRSVLAEHLLGAWMHTEDVTVKVMSLLAPGAMRTPGSSNGKAEMGGSHV